MEWIKMADQEPEIEDLPFVTFKKELHKVYELWEDTDWHSELTEKDRLEWTHWCKVRGPES